jgi:PadR family transcriptional regulator PadR
MGRAKQAETEGELLPGTLDMLILRTLARGVMHGYDIAQAIKRASGDVLKVEEGALYPAVHRLEMRGLLASDWGHSLNNRRAKYYRLTPLGRKRLGEAVEKWDRIAAAIARVMSDQA